MMSSGMGPPTGRKRHPGSRFRCRLGPNRNTTTPGARLPRRGGALQPSPVMGPECPSSAVLWWPRPVSRGAVVGWDPVYGALCHYKTAADATPCAAHRPDSNPSHRRSPVAAPSASTTDDQQPGARPGPTAVLTRRRCPNGRNPRRPATRPASRTSSRPHPNEPTKHDLNAVRSPGWRRPGCC